MALRLANLIATSLRYKLLVLVLFPILLVAPLTVGFVVYWSQGFTQDQLLRRVNSDLTVAHASFIRLQQDYLSELKLLAASHAFRTAFEDADATRIQDQLAAVRATTGFDFLHVTDLQGRWLFAITPTYYGGTKHSPLQQQAAWGLPEVGIEVFTAEELYEESTELAEYAKLPLIDTRHAAKTERGVEDRALVIRAIVPVRDPRGTIVALLDGGVVLNKSFELVDGIRSLVYGPGSLPEGSNGAVTLFLDDVRISTNVRLEPGERAIGTRASEEVRDSVLRQGNAWVDYAFVVNDWYISAYEPIIDVYGRRVGMLHSGFLEAPFRHAYYRTLGLALFFLALAVGFASLLAVRGARAIFAPIEAIASVVRSVRGGEDRRIGELASRDEIGELARQFDATLNELQLRNDEIRQAAERLETKVDERTRELKEKNRRLEDTIEQLKATRRQLVEAEKLAALGELTAGVAHEINNPIAVIQGNMEVLSAELGNHVGPVEMEIQLVLEQIARIQAIVDKLLRFSRPGEYSGEIREIDPSGLIESTLSLVEHESSIQGVSIVTQFRTTRPVSIDPQELQQVLVNLLVNAIHASRSGQIVEIATRDWDSRGIVIAVRDRGAGIKASHLDRVFDPFFTTKKVGGTGLGLSVSYGLIRRYGGDIRVRSEEGHGATFEVYLRCEPEFGERNAVAS